MRNCGNLPTLSSGNLDRDAVAKKYGFSKEEIGSAAWAFFALYKREPESTITFKEYLDAMLSAGLSPSMIGKSMTDWQFARYTDSGPYSIESARFVTALTNQRERNMDYMRNAKTRALIGAAQKALPRKKCIKCGGAFSPSMHSRWHGDRCRKSDFDKGAYP